MVLTSPVKIWRNQKKIAKDIGKIGVIESFTLIRIPPSGFEKESPYPVVLVALDNKKMIGQLVDYDNYHLRTGQKVKAVLRRIKVPDKEEVIPYGIKFKPV